MRTRTNSTSTYKRKHADSGLAGQYNEVNLCTYLLMEANIRLETTVAKDKHIEEFYIASNMDLVNRSPTGWRERKRQNSNIGQAACIVDDIIFKYSYTDKDGVRKEHASFIQSKHKITEENLTLEKLFASKDNGEWSVLQKYHEGYRTLKKHILENKTNDPIFSTAIEDVDIILFTTAPLGGLKVDAFKEFKKENNDFLYFTDIYHKTNEGISKDTTDGLIFSRAKNGGIKKHEAFKKFKEEKKYFSDFTNVYYKLDTTVSCKPSHIMESVNIMELLNNNSDCQNFVTSLVDALCSGASNGNILSDYKIPILDEIINITAPRVGRIKPEFAKGDIKSPFEQCFETEIKSKLFKPDLSEIELVLPQDYGTINENDSGKLILPYTKKYFEEFLNKFKIYVNQPSECEITKHIEEKIRVNYAKNEREANEIAITMTSKVRDYWQDMSENIDYLDKNSSIIKNSGNFATHFNVCRPVYPFTDRGTKLQELDKMLKQGICVVYGLGGIGKTQFIRKYIQQYFSRDYVIWIDAENHNKITESFNNLVNTKLSFLKDEESDKLIKLVFEYFSNKSCLFVFDNAENTEYLRKTLSFTKLFKKWQPYIAITSRDTEWESPIQTFKLDVLQIEEAIHMIKTGLNIKNEREDNDARKLAETLGCYPLALQQAISYIADERFSKNYGIKTYIHEFNSDEAKILASGECRENIDNDYKTTTLKTWTITIRKIISNQLYGDVAMLIFRIIAYCAPNAIHTTMFYRLPNVTEQQVDEGINLLVKYSMVNADDGGNNETQLSVHRLVQDVTRIKLKGTDKEIDVLENALIIFDKNITRLTLDHASAVWTFASGNENLVKRFGHNFKDIIEMLFKESRFEEAENFSTTSREVLIKYFPLDDQTIIDVDIEACKVLLRLSKYNLANELIEDLQARVPADNTEKTLEVGCLRATMLSQDSKYDEALELFKKLLPECLNPGHTTCIKIREGIANIHKRKGRYGESMTLFTEILEILQREESTSNENFDKTLLFQAKANIASCHKYLAEYDAALSIFKEILSMQTEEYGENNAMTLRTLNNISVVYTKQGKYDAALEILRKSLDIKLKLYRDICSSILVTKHNIAAIYLFLPPEKHEEGLVLLREVVEQRKGLLGPSHKSTLNSMKKLALMLHKMGKYDEAMETNKYVYDNIIELYKDENHPQAMELFVNMAKIHQDQGLKSKALRMVDKVLNVKMDSKDFGPDHPETLTVAFLKAQILGNIGRTKEALAMLEDIQFKMLKSLGEDHSSYKLVIDEIKKLEVIYCESLTVKSFMLRIMQQIIFLLVLGYIFYNVFIENFIL